MAILNNVSETALITLKSRSKESQKKQPILHSNVDVELLNGMIKLLPHETKERIINRELPATFTRHIALRARKYDDYVRRFIEKESNGLVVSLGCGFDTRYWRVSEHPWRYMEVDLPEVIEIKRQVLKEKMEYATIGCSVSENRWVKEISEIQKEKVLFLAEGLFMYLSPDVVADVFMRISDTFSKSSIAFEVVNKRYTQGIWKKMVKSKMKRKLKSEAGSSYDFGVRSADEIESFGNNIRIAEEWSYFEDKDIKPKFLYLLRNFKFVSKTQWTIKALIG